MSSELPISLTISTELIETFISIKGIGNKLEAQLNFQTLAAGWYGDEENILFINIYLQSPEDFAFQQTQNCCGNITIFADDVFSCHNQEQHQFDCYIAITTNELALISQYKNMQNEKLQAKFLSDYLDKKVVKVINLIANKLTLTSI